MHIRWHNAVIGKTNAIKRNTMEACERETIICINDADLQDGYFSFGTSKRNHYERLKKKVGDWFIDEKIETCGGVPVYWSIKVKAECLTKKGFGIRTPRVVTDAEREKRRIASAHLSKYRFSKKNGD